MTFETDLARYLDADDRAARAEEATRAEFGDDYRETFAVAGEAATLIPANDVLDADLPGWFNRVEGCDLVMTYRAGQYGDEYGRD